MSPALLALALAATTSTSKLGVFVAGDIGTTTSPAPIISVCPRLAVFPIDPVDQDPAATIGPRVTTYRATCPGGRVVFQIGGSSFDLTLGGALQAQWPTWQMQLNAVAAPGDGVEGPAGFWPQLALLLSSASYLPLIGAATFTTPAAFCATVAAVRQAGVSQFGWTFHALTAMTFSTTDAVFGFDQFTAACALVGVPLFLTQVSPMSGAWDQSAMTWLAWFDQQIAQDTDLQGAALFQLGAAPDISAIATQLVAYFPNPVMTDGGFPDGGTDAASTGSVVTPGHGAVGGTLSPPGEGCSTAGPGFLALALVPVLLLVRRRTRGRRGRGSTSSPRTG
jgi:hypothetical protein